MPDIRWAAVIPTTKPFPAWGSSVIGRTGDRRCDLLVEGVAVSRRYRAARTALVTDDTGATRIVRVAGSGGHFTVPSQRRRGYAALLEQDFLAVSAAEGFELAMLFCLDPLVPRNRALGWHLIPGSARCVTYTQPGQGEPVTCPARIWTGLKALVPDMPVTAIRGLHVEGLPW